MSRARRTVMWVVAVLCAAAVVGLGLLAGLASMDMVNRVTAIVVAAAAVVGLAISVYTLLQPPATSAGSAGATSPNVEANGTGALAAGGIITGNAIGKGAKVTPHPGPPAPPPPPVPGAPSTGQSVHADGRGALAAGQDISGNAVGADSEVG